MSQGILNTLNIKSLDEILAETDEFNNNLDDAPEEESDDDEEEQLPVKAPASSSAELMARSEMTNKEHGKKMDEIYGEAIEIARTVADMANNIDPAKASRMFEVAGQHLKIAIDAQSTKRDAELKLMKLIQDQKKLDLDELRIKTELGNTDNIKGEVIMVEDRNALLAQLKAQK